MRIGIDLGGTKVEAMALDARGEGPRRRMPTPRHDYDGTIRAILDLVTGLDPGGVARVGVGIPGALSRVTGRVKNANSTWLNGRPLLEDLRVALGRPTRVANDANCFALSEACDGAARGHAVVFGVILGTGVGGGIAIDGRPLIGANAIAGEWGHSPLPWPTDGERPGPACYCGKVGCVETFLSGPGLAADHARLTGGPALTAEAVVARAASGDARAEATLRRYEDRLARGLASVVNLLDPDVIVLGGGLGGVDRFHQSVPALLPRHVFSDRVDTKVVRPLHGDSSGVRGAAWLWPAEDGA